MAEQSGNLVFNPSIEGVINKLVNDSIKNMVLRSSKEAHDLVISQWNKGAGYDSNGLLSPWTPNKRKNPTLIDTATLKSSLNIVIIDGGFDFMFEVSGSSDYASGLSVEEVSDYNSDRPHTGVPREYTAEPDIGSEAYKILVEEITSVFKKLVSSRKIQVL